MQMRLIQSSPTRNTEVEMKTSERIFESFCMLVFAIICLCVVNFSQQVSKRILIMHNQCQGNSLMAQIGMLSVRAISNGGCRSDDSD